MYSICVKMGIDPQYFLHKMEMYELKAIIELYSNDYQEDWNQTRLLMHSIYQSQNSKELEYSDIMKFPWDEDYDEIESTEEEKEATRKFALELQNKLNGISN